MKKPKKVALIGLDCAITHLIDKHIAEGHLPTFKKLFEGGVVMDNAMVPFPTITPPNWTTIATGAWPGTHGITDYWRHIPATTPNNFNIASAFSSVHNKVETIWEAADKAGKKCIVLNYPSSWPSRMENGIMVGGAGLCVGNNNEGQRGTDTLVSLCGEQMITTGVYPNTIRGEFKPAEGWSGVDEMGEEPLEMAATLNFPSADCEPEKTTWNVLVRDLGGDGYDTVTLSPTKNMADAFCTLKQREWSKRIETNIQTKDKGERGVWFRVKLVELSDDAEDFRLFFSGMGSVKGWTTPEELADELYSELGTLGRGAAYGPYYFGWIDAETYVDVNEQYSRFLADTVKYLLSNKEWDMFFMHSHPTDWVYHAVLTEMEDMTKTSDAKQKEAWDVHLGVYETQDRLLASILEVLDDDTLVVLISDHGATADGPLVDPYKPLIDAGLCVLQETRDDLVKDGGKFAEAFKIGAQIANPAKSKAMPQRSCYVYVNLKGRDPEGIVEPEDYEKVQRQIIDAMYTYVDPKTGGRPFALVLSKQDARIMGLAGEEMGDVIYATYPEYGSQHGSVLPTAEWGNGSLKALFTFYGPGVKKGLREQRSCWITDFTPTICYALGMPVPSHCEGAVLYQIFEDPDFKRKEVEELKDKLAEMEKQLS